MIKPNLLIVAESAVYGGHEAMFMSILRGIHFELEESFEITFLVNSKNHRLIQQLGQADYSEIETVPVSLSRFPIKPITGFFLPFDFLNLRKVINKVAPKLVLNIQGTIEIGCTTLRVCKSLGIPAVSYLPITKSSADLAVFLGKLRDEVCRRYYYSIPKKIITISEGNARDLSSFFDVPAQRVTVVHNFVESNAEPFENQLPDFSEDKIHLALVGRISNAQKRQYDFMQVWLSSPIHQRYVVHVVGDDDSFESRKLRDFCRSAVENGDVMFHGWRLGSYVSAVVRRCQAVLIPSRFEGVPLVMIEAVQLGRLVVASDVDGMNEFLPASLRFNSGDWEHMFKIISMLNEHDNYVLLRKMVVQQFSVFDKQASLGKFMRVLCE